MQVMLDRGEELDWFGSGEIVMEAIIASFTCSSFTRSPREPFVSPTLFRDRNFTAGVIFILVVGLTYYASLAPQPSYLQNPMGLSIVSAGFVLRATPFRSADRIA
jgi:DHA2 family multidrug resistance protein